MNPDEIRNVPEAKTAYGRLVSEIRNRTTAEIYLALNKAIGIEQKKFCQILGIDAAYFSRILAGVRAGRPSPDCV